jgi:hypothetical protein
MPHLFSRVRKHGVKPWRIGLAAGVLVAAAGSAGIALGSIPDSNGVIHGCYKNGNGRLSVIDTNASQNCKSDQTPLNWNQTGPQGPVGPAGPQVPPGPAGGIASMRVVQQQPDLPANSDTQLYIHCPTGYIAISGGYINQLSHAPAQIVIRRSTNDATYPGGQPETWDFSVDNTGSDVPQGYTSFEAFCIPSAA